MYHRNQSMSAPGSTGLAFLTGVALGGVAMMLLPDQHKQKIKNMAQNATSSLGDMMNTDERAARIKDIFNENTAKARAIYDETRRSLSNTLADLGDQLDSIDEKKYAHLVDDTVAYIQEHHQLPKKNADKLRKYLQSDFKRLDEIA
ncbi:MAG TPA: hypothetical protein VF209_01450 [Patescibacteria group bacterium]